MATTGAAADSLGPRFGPEDPTLPKPWKGLIDGSTGLLYYWNPDTNVTQYERPAGSAPPLPSGPPPSATTPNLASTSLMPTVPSNSVVSQQTTPQTVQAGQKMQANQLMQQQQPQQMSQQAPNQQPQQMPYQVPNQQIAQPRNEQYPHMQMPYQHMSYLQGQFIPPPQQGLQFSYHPGPQTNYNQGQPQQVPQIPVIQQTQEPQNMHRHDQQPQTSQIPPQAHFQQGLQAHYHHGQQPGLQSAHVAGQQGPTSKVSPASFSKMEEVAVQQGKQAGVQLPMAQQGGIISSGHQQPGGMPSINISPVGVHSLQPNRQFAEASPYRQQQMSGRAVPSHVEQSPVRPPMGLNMGYNEDRNERVGNDFYSSSRFEGPKMVPQQPKLAPLPIPQNPPVKFLYLESLRPLLIMLNSPTVRFKTYY